MSDSDPGRVLAALDRAEDAFEERGHGRPSFEDGISPDADWKTQLTKGCRLLEVAQSLEADSGYHTAIIEVCFGAIERSIEAYALAMGGDELGDFQNHSTAYRRAGELGLFSEETARGLQDIYGDNRTESYYGGNRPTDEQAVAMVELATAVHDHSVDQILREGGVCICDN